MVGKYLVPGNILVFKHKLFTYKIISINCLTGDVTIQISSNLQHLKYNYQYLKSECGSAIVRILDKNGNYVWGLPDIF